MKAQRVDLPLIRKVIRQIVDRCRPQRIILFGSHAYGYTHRDSDVDLLVVMQSRKRPAERASDVMKSLRFYPFPMDILVRTPSEIRRRLHVGDPFYEEIESKGKILYERHAQP